MEKSTVPCCDHLLCPMRWGAALERAVEWTVAVQVPLVAVIAAVVSLLTVGFAAFADVHRQRDEARQEAASLRQSNASLRQAVNVYVPSVGQWVIEPDGELLRVSPFPAWSPEWSVEPSTHPQQVPGAGFGLVPESDDDCVIGPPADAWVELDPHCHDVPVIIGPPADAWGDVYLRDGGR